MSEKNLTVMRNPETPSGIRRSEGRGRATEGDAAGLPSRGSEPGPSNRRGSDPGSTRNPRMGAAPTAAGAAPGRRSRAYRGSITCRACGETKPADAFVLRADPVAEARGWGTRFWCGPCLVTGGHITQAVLDAATGPLYEPVELAPEQRAAVDAKVREHTLFVQMLDRAAADPVYAAALRRAARDAHMVAVTPEPADDSADRSLRSA